MLIFSVSFQFYRMTRRSPLKFGKRLICYSEFSLKHTENQHLAYENLHRLLVQRHEACNIVSTVDRARTHVSDVRNFAVGSTEVRPRALQTSECNELLDPTRTSYLILVQRQPGKLLWTELYVP